MSENQWRKREITSLECPSGNVIQIRRAGPELALRAGKVARILQTANKETAQDVNAQLALIETLSDDELVKVMAFARTVIVEVVVQPRIVMKPQEHELGPDDLPLSDFWFIFTWAMNGGPTMPVKMKEGETTVEAVQNFPSGQDSGVDVSGDSEQVQ